MLVFLDSSILCTDFYMKGTCFELIKRASGVHIILAEIVIDEVKNKHKEMLLSHMQNANKAIKELNRLTVDSTPLINESFLSKEEKEYSDFIDMFLIESGSTIAEMYPNISHKEIVSRALQRRKPFKSDGKDGYRDFLVWYTFLHTVKSYFMETACFITLNKKDFSDTKNEKLLHPDLIADISEFGIEKERVQYWTSIKDYTDNIIIPQLNEADEHEKFSNSLLSDKIGFADPLEGLLTEKAIGIDLDGYDVLIVGENPSISSIEEIYGTEIEKATNVSDNEFLLEIHLDTVCTIESFIFKSELAAMSDDDLGDAQIINSNYNDHYASAETETGLKIEIETIFDVRKKTFSSFDISDISDYNCPYCPYD